MSDTIPVAQLRAYVERVERVEADIKSLNDDKSGIYKEARGNGFDVKAIRAVVAKRKLDTDDREERDAIFDLYWNALHGVAEGEPRARAHTHAREKAGPRLIEAAKEMREMVRTGEAFDPSTGEILNSVASTDESSGLTAGVSLSTAEVAAADEVAGVASAPAESASEEISAPIEHPTPGSSPCAASDQTGGEVLPDAPPVAQFEPPTFLTKDSTAPKPVANERCSQPATCKFSHHPQKITCGTCSTAWAIAQRKKAVPA